jgi:hypothetical protein
MKEFFISEKMLVSAFGEGRSIVQRQRAARHRQERLIISD